MYKEFGISESLENLAKETENEIENVMYNSKKVLKAFHNANVSDMHFGTSTGYGHNDVGRDCIERVFAEVLGAEDSLVRNQFISGTHALATSLFALLRPNDILLAISRKAI